jgi:hypothetical protein
LLCSNRISLKKANTDFTPLTIGIHRFIWLKPLHLHKPLPLAKANGNSIQNRKMKQKIAYAIIAFLVAFGATFYIIRTYFPKHKVEKTSTVKDTLTKAQK